MGKAPSTREEALEFELPSTELRVKFTLSTRTILLAIVSFCVVFWAVAWFTGFFFHILVAAVLFVGAILIATCRKHD